MKNYMISEIQFNRLVEQVTQSIEMRLIDAMRIALKTFKEKGFDDEQFVDFVLRLREKDPYTIHLAQDMEGDLLFQKAIKRLIQD